MSIQLQTSIRQLDQRSVTWQRFLEKASAGSSKAVDMLCQNAMALAVQIAGPPIIDRASVADYEHTLAASLPRQVPFPDAQSFADQLTHTGIAGAILVMHTTPLHTRTAYDNLWAQERVVSSTDMLHDSVLQCVDDWRVVTFLERMRSVEQDALNYNSLHAVVCMLMLSSAWSALPEQASSL